MVLSISQQTQSTLEKGRSMEALGFECRVSISTGRSRSEWSKTSSQPDGDSRDYGPALHARWLRGKECALANCWNLAQSRWKMGWIAHQLCKSPLEDDTSRRNERKV